MSMLRYYFSKTEEDNKYLFDNLAISKCDSKYLEHMNEYLVISITLKSAKQPNCEMAYTCLIKEISYEFIIYWIVTSFTEIFIVQIMYILTLKKYWFFLFNCYNYWDRLGDGQELEGFCKL